MSKNKTNIEKIKQDTFIKRNCSDLGHSDPDNSGHCIYCGFILDND